MVAMTAEKRVTSKQKQGNWIEGFLDLKDVCHNANSE
jgi:hypothetical protein